MRNYEIDLWKFIFSIVIVLLHSFNLFGGENKFMPGGSIGVDFFFIVTGYLMMNSIDKKTYVQSGGEFVWCKFKYVAPYFYISVFISFLLRSYFGIDEAPLLHKILLLVNEIFLLQAAGFSVYAVTGSAWYLSAMFIAIALLYPVVIKYRKEFVDTYSVIVGILLIGSMSSGIGTTSNPGYMIGGFCFLGLLKAVAEISLGIFAYGIANKINDVGISKSVKCFLTALKYFGFLFVIYFASFNESNGIIGFSNVVLLLLSIILTFSDVTFKCLEKLARKIKLLGEFSVCIYLNNYYWALIVYKLYPYETILFKISIYLLSVMTTSCLVLWTVKYCKKEKVYGYFI